MEEEKFGEILPPLEFGTGWPTYQHCMSIGVLGGCLSVTVNTESLDVWVLKKCDSEESWTKQFVIDTLIEGPLKPLQMLSDSHVLMIRRDLLLVCYDANEKTFQYIKFDGFVSVYKSVMLHPSFVPLKDALRVNSVMVQNMQ